MSAEPRFDGKTAREWADTAYSRLSVGEAMEVIAPLVAAAARAEAEIARLRADKERLRLQLQDRRYERIEPSEGLYMLRKLEHEVDALRTALDTALGLLEEVSGNLCCDPSCLMDRVRFDRECGCWVGAFRHKLDAFLAAVEGIV